MAFDRPLGLLALVSLLVAAREGGAESASRVPAASDLAGRWILGSEACARTPNAGACSELQIVSIDIDGHTVVARLERPSPGLQRVGVRKGRVMFSLSLQPDGGLGGDLRAVYPPERRCSPEPFISAPNAIVGAVFTPGAVARLTLDYDYRPYDHARCALHTGSAKRQTNTYHRLGAE
jgi:hypothetical protein